MKKTRKFDEAAQYLPERLRRALIFLPDNIKKNTFEIRLRCQKPIALTNSSSVLFVDETRVSADPGSSKLIISEDELAQTVINLCNNSVFAHEEEIKQGFISLKNGSRAGVCGDFSGGGLAKAFSVNLRIAREFDDFDKCLLKGINGGILIAGAPGSGKTTLLRQIIKCYSNGALSDPMRVCVVDSRREICTGFDVGFNTDVLITADKFSGTQIALRTMNPQIIAFDEIGNTDEITAVKDCFNAGVRIITTVHAGSKTELQNRIVIKELVKTNAIEKIFLLPGIPGGQIKDFYAREMFN